jgi:hypothetical protein
MPVVSAAVAYVHETERKSPNRWRALRELEGAVAQYERKD